MSQHDELLRRWMGFFGSPPLPSILSQSKVAFWQRCCVAWVLTALIWMGLSPTAAYAQSSQGREPSFIQPYIDRVMDRVTEFTLNNGMTFIVLERHQAPVVSFMTYVDVGAAYEKPGKTGAAHFLEHLAFKGTRRIGTTDYQAEQPLLDRLDVVFEQLQQAKAANQPEAVATLQQEFDALREQAARYVQQNEFGQIVEREGGVGLNATTSADATRYFYSFPANKLELWMSLESERFLEPVFREFYEEKDVILEERRLRTDNSPIGKMTEVFLETAFPEHPYGRPIIGYEDDIRNLTRADIQEFFETYYTPRHITVAVVGDVDPDEVRRLATIYFGRYRSRSRAADIQPPVSNQAEPREFTLRLPAQPWYLEGYQRPSVKDADDVVYQMITSLLIGGRTSRLYQALVEQQIALSVDVANAFPGDRYSNVLLFLALTSPGHTVDDIAAVLDQELNRLKTELVSDVELDRVKTQSRASLLKLLSSNQGLASLLADYQAKTGRWQNLFEQLKEIEAITAEDVQRVARATFVPEKKTIGRLLPPEPSSEDK